MSSQEFITLPEVSATVNRTRYLPSYFILVFFIIYLKLNFSICKHTLDGFVQKIYQVCSFDNTELSEAPLCFIAIMTVVRICSLYPVSVNYEEMGLKCRFCELHRKICGSLQALWMFSARCTMSSMDENFLLVIKVTMEGEKSRGFDFALLERMMLRVHPETGAEELMTSTGNPCLK